MMAPPTVKICWAGLSISHYPLHQQEGQVDIALEFVDAGEDLRCVIKADPRHFSLAGIATFTQHFTQL
ncbi:hypothetical protein LXA52_17880, partial [Erwinia amylovora]|uniref:hypothetical protein n=1 Tax=Erwinia amylovora TaxID=552 RepID=UPI0020BF82B3